MPSAATAKSEVKDAKEVEEVKEKEAGRNAGPFHFIGIHGCGRSAATNLTRGGFVTAEDAELACGAADFGEGLIQTSGVVRFNINEELIFPGPAVDRPAFDLQKIHILFRKGRERGKERAGAVR